MEYLDPRKNPNQWLLVTLDQLVEDNTESSKEMLKYAHYQLLSWFEPGLLDQLFPHWMEDYVELMDATQNNKNISPHECSPKDSLVSQEQS